MPPQNINIKDTPSIITVLSGIAPLMLSTILPGWWEGIAAAGVVGWGKVACKPAKGGAGRYVVGQSGGVGRGAMVG